MRDDRQIKTFVLALLGIPGVGSKTVLKALKAHRQRIEEAEFLDEAFARSLQIKAINRGLAQSDGGWNAIEADADGTIEAASRCGAHVLQPFDAKYPQRLLANDSYPPVLFARGDISALNACKAVAIIGTRKPTRFGAKMGRRLAQILAEDGYVVVSGLALGCDTVGHEGALDVGGKTIAVLPTPIDAPVYPRQNLELAQRILDTGGVLLSEYMPGKKLLGRQLTKNLVARDQWQPGLSDGVIAIETSTTGGTNHALNHALKTRTPIAVFDYSSLEAIGFDRDERFGGNVEQLKQGATGIFAPETIDVFKQQMEEYRQRAIGEAGNQAGDDGQLPLTLF